MLDLDGVLRFLVQNRGSDLHLKVGRPPLYRLSGNVIPADHEPVTEEDIKSALYAMMTEDQVQSFEATHELDFSYSIAGLARFRLNVFQQKGNIGAVARVVPLQTPTIDSLRLPPVLKDIASKPQGLVLVTGPTGSGKTTTLAAMIQYINETRQSHIITIEDPIEFVYTDANCLVNQREIGLDTDSFAEALRHVLRQDPDVILVGEMRDRETISTAVTAAETGHLVFSTLHTIDATQSIDRIIDTFPSEQHRQVRLQLSMALQAVISQRLCRRADGAGRVPAMEIMINSPTIRKFIEDGQTGSIKKAIEQSVTHYRMQTLNQSLTALCKKGFITFEEGLTASNNPDEFKRNMKGIFESGAAAGAQSTASGR